MEEIRRLGGGPVAWVEAVLVKQSAVDSVSGSEVDVKVCTH